MYSVFDDSLENILSTLTEIRARLGHLISTNERQIEESRIKTSELWFDTNHLNEVNRKAHSVINKLNELLD